MKIITNLFLTRIARFKSKIRFKNKTFFKTNTFFRLAITNCLLALILNPQCFATVQAGTAMTSFTSGRQVPGLQLGLETANLLFSATATGYRTKYDYLSGYILSGYKLWTGDTLLGAPVKLGFGLGGYYSKRGYKETLSSETKSKDDFGLGPCFTAGIYPFDFMYLRIEALFGVGNINNIFLTFQDMAQLSLGVDL